MRTRVISAAATMIAVSALLGLAPAARAVPGDVDGDGQVTANDARFVDMVAGGLFQSFPTMVTNGDVASAAGNTPDGHLTLVDAVRILRAVNGLDTLGTAAGAKSAPLADTVTISANLAKNYKLPPGFTLSGTVKTTTGQSVTSTPGVYPSLSGALSLQNAANPVASDSASAAAGTGAYSVVLAAGTYSVNVTTSYLDINFSTGDFVTWSVFQPASPNSVTIAADKTQNFVRPDLPATGQISGAITGTSMSVQNVSFGSNTGSAAALPADGSYSITSPPGTGTFTIMGDYALDPNVSILGSLNSSPVTVTSGGTVTHNIAVPDFGTVHGTVTAPAGTAFTSIYGGNSIFQQGGSGDLYSSSYQSQTATPTAYRLALPNGTQPAAINLSYAANPNTSLGYVTQVTASAADPVQNYTLPALPTLYTFSGIVQDSAGKPLAGATVSAATHFTGTPSPGYYSSAHVTTTSTGAFSLTLLPGTYNVTVTPS